MLKSSLRKGTFVMIIFFRFFLILLLFTSTLLANNELQREYIITDKQVMLSDIINNPNEDILLYTINNARHSKRVKASEVLQKLKSYGYKNYHSKHAYIQFTQKSPIDTSNLEEQIKSYYKEYYKDIQINDIFIKPSRYITFIPKKYTIGFSRNAELSRKGTLYIKTQQNKKIFFNYILDATVSVFETKKVINKGDELSYLNSKKKSIILDKFRAMPIMELPRGHYEAKHRLKKFSLLTKRDVTTLFLIKRGSRITVTLQDTGVSITFSGRALQNGRFGDTIAVMHDNKKKIYVIVTGKNRAKVK